jgi:hypothetical protein
MNQALTIEEHRDFRAVLLKDIPYFHQLYAKYQDPKWLQHARETGELIESITRRIEKP